jgi:recombinational DNA repair protein RecT
MSEQKPPVDALVKQEAWRATQSFQGTVAGSDKEATNAIRLRLTNIMETLARRSPGDYDEVLATPKGRQSIRHAVSVALETGLFPGTFQPHAWLIPRKERGTKMLFWQPSARGLAFLAHRAGYTLSVDLVYVGDKALMLYEQASTERTVTADWRPAQTGPCPVLDLVAKRVPLVENGGKERTLNLSPLAGALVVARDTSGRVVNWRWCGSAEIAKRRAVSAFGSVWLEWPEEMAEKTAIIYALSRGICPTTLEIRAAMEADHDNTPAPEPIEIKTSPAALPETRQIAPALPIDDLDPEEEIAHRDLSAREKIEIMADEAGMPINAYLGSIGWTKPPEALTEADAERLLSSRSK